MNEEDRQLVLDELAAAGREDGRTPDQTRQVLLVVVGRGASAPATVWGHAAAHLGAADAIGDTRARDPNRKFRLKSNDMRRCDLRSQLAILFLAILLLLGVFPTLQSATGQTQTTLGFDGLPDLSLNVDDFGVHFTGAQVLACGGSLNCGLFPPFSGANVIYDVPGFGGVITATFDPAVVGIVDTVSARVTGNRNVTMTAFGDQGQILGTAQTGGPNYVGSGSGLPANLLLAISSAAGPIVKVTFHDTGNTFTVDDFFFRSSQRLVVIDPGHGQILENGVLTYQRPPSPTYGLIEDVLTLDMSISAQATLQGASISVLLTRNSNAAPFAPANCPVPCFADLNMRVRWAEKQEPDLLVSIHTNGGVPTAHGTESYYSTAAPSPDSAALAAAVLSRVATLNLNNRGLKQINFNILNTSMPIALIEVAFHSNSQLATGQSITDETRLNDPVFRLLAAQAIANGIEDFYASH